MRWLASPPILRAVVVWRSLSLWKRALVVAVALYVLGFQPHVELSAQCGDREIEHRHVALVLAAVNVRIFEIDLVTGEAWGTGYGERESVLMQPPCPHGLVPVRG